MCLWVYYHDNSKLLEIACIDLHQTGSVAESIDRLQLIKFWPSCAPGKGVCGGAKIFGSALLQPASSVCVSASAFFIDLVRLVTYRTAVESKSNRSRNHCISGASQK